MASGSHKAQDGSWTEEESKRFEMVLARYEEGCPRRWANVARAVGGRSAGEVELHYHHLRNGINHIDSAQQPFFQFPASTARSPLLQYRHRRPKAEGS